MALTQIDGLRQLQDGSVDLSKMLADFLGGSDWDISGGNQNATIVGLAASTTNDGAVNKGQMDSAISAALTGSMSYKGTIDASIATGAALDGALIGDFYLVSAAGVLDGISFSVGDHLVVNADITDFDVDGAGKIDIVDNTEAADILRTSDIINDLVTGGVNDVLSAQQGVVLKGFIDNLQGELDDTQTGAGLAADGSYAANGAANYISTATSLKNADDLLDAQAKANADAIVVNAGDISTNAGNITTLQNALIDRVFGEKYQPIVDSTSYTVANFPIDAGTLRVYDNGMRLSLTDDYTVNESTGVITFVQTLKAGKANVVVDYEY